MIYHILRTTGQVPATQMGMNVKMWIENPISELFITFQQNKHKDYQKGFEPIPDIVIFKPEINADWRRRNYANTLENILIAIEVKASERQNKRLTQQEIELDIYKLAAHREEVIHRGSSMFPIMLIIDSAPTENERIKAHTLEKISALAKNLEVALMYISPNQRLCEI